MTRKKRDKIIGRLASLIVHLYGRRCDVSEPCCATCNAWIMFDTIDRITDSSLLESDAGTKK